MRGQRAPGGGELPLLAPRFSREIVRCPDCGTALSAAHWIANDFGQLRPVCPRGCDSSARIMASAQPPLPEDPPLEPGKRRKIGPNVKKRRKPVDLAPKRCGVGLNYEAITCGQPFKPRSNNAGYCERCREIVKKAMAKEKQRGACLARKAS